MHYSYGLSLVNSHLLAGATVVLTKHSFMRPEFWSAFDRAGCTSLAGVPLVREQTDLLANLRRQNIFEFVGELAELIVAAGSRVALQRVHGAANATNHFVVGRPSLKFEARVIQRLQ